jgi:hypothetical protein
MKQTPPETSRTSTPARPRVAHAADRQSMAAVALLASAIVGCPAPRSRGAEPVASVAPPASVAAVAPSASVASVAPPASAASVAPPASAAAVATASGAATGDPAPPPGLDVATLAWPWRTIGSPCASVPQCPVGDGESYCYDPSDYRYGILCSSDGRVSGIFRSSALPVLRANGKPLPADRTLYAARDPQLPLFKGMAFEVKALGGYLDANHITCGHCARVMGRAFFFAPWLMTDEHLAMVQGEFALPASPPLRSADAWAKAYSRR